MPELAFQAAHHNGRRLEWSALLQRHPPALLERVGALVDEHKQSLSEHFYRHMQSDEQGALYLSHERVEAQLKPSLCHWLQGLFAARGSDQVDALIAQQQHVGEVHARVEIPISLVMRGARLLKHDLYALFARELPEDQRLAATELTSDTIDIAMVVMSQAFSLARDRSARAEEAYRLFSVAQNLAAERARQHAGLLQWENQLLFDLSTHSNELPRLLRSEFGIWLMHKAAHAFAGAPEMSDILEQARLIDNVLLARLRNDKGIQRDPLDETRHACRTIAYLLDYLFDRAEDLDAGRDTLTRLLNRKFLPVVLSREIEMARSTKSTFAVLMLDVDHFKQINDRFGHEAGDVVLQQVAGLLTNSIRAGDYAFRQGGEEFLLVLVQSGAEDARMLAERVRRRIEAETFLLQQHQVLRITASIGVALFDGHPDYQRSLHNADQALYAAKNGGRNRVVVWQD